MSKTDTAEEKSSEGSADEWTDVCAASAEVMAIPSEASVKIEAPGHEMVRATIRNEELTVSVFLEPSEAKQLAGQLEAASEEVRQARVE